MTEMTKLPGNTTNFFTIVAQNYLAQAFVLGESVLRCHPGAVFTVFLLDDSDRRWKAAIESRGFRVIYPKEISLPDFRKFVFQYNITEASTGVKPFVFQTLFGRGAEAVIYLDPDILCFRRFDEVLDALNEFSIVLTPHICSPVPRDYFPGEKSVLRTGLFNLGFIAIRQGSTGLAFLEWWSEHLKDECISEADTGLFVDQKWIDLVPTCFDHVFILRSLAYNIAYWNLHERFLETRGDGVLYEAGSGTPVAFIHYSGIALDDLDSICKYTARNPFDKECQLKRNTLAERPDLIAPFRRYKELLIAEDVQKFSQIPYRYAAYDSGETISQLERSLYLNSAVWLGASVDPFSIGPGSFRDACRRAGLRPSQKKESKTSSDAVVKKYALYMRAIELCLKVCVRVLGSDKYLEFAKYMRHQLLSRNQSFLLPETRASSEPVQHRPGEEQRQGYEKVVCENSKV